jgi:hypothetical protein
MLLLIRLICCKLPLAGVDLLKFLFSVCSRLMIDVEAQETGFVHEYTDSHYWN